MKPQFIYEISREDMKKSWEFALNYFLDEKKPIKDRTNGQKRGLGGIVDSFLNKIIEIAVCEKLHELNPKKEFETDFKIHPLNKSKTEPDIINIFEKNRKSPKPRLYVEIKNSGEADDWFGPKASEIKSIKKNVFGIKDTKKMFYIFCEIKDKKGQSRKSSPLGIWLKTNLKNDRNLKKFHNISDLFVQFNFVFTVWDIDKFGTTLEEGTPLPDTNVFPKVADPTKKRINKRFNDCEVKRIIISNGKLPKITASRLDKENKKWLPYPTALGDFTISGKLEYFVEELKTVRNCWIRCKTDVRVNNDVLGNPCGTFKKNEIVLFKVIQKGEVREKNATDRFVAKCNMQITKKFSPKRMQQIANII